MKQTSKDKLLIADVAVTTTAAELNLLDRVSGLVKADLTKLAAVDSTAAELNIVDGGTSATATTLVAADRVVVNDAGAMVQVAMSDFETFMESNLDTLSSVTTVGALDSGSITSGFTSIDVGAGAITTTGTISAGTLDVADAGIAIIPNGTGYNNQTTNGEIELAYISSGTAGGYIYFMVNDVKYRVLGSAV